MSEAFFQNFGINGKVAFVKITEIANYTEGSDTFYNVKDKDQ